MEIISTKNAPEAIGPYSQATISGNVVYTSGQIAIDPMTNEFISGNIIQQTERVLKNLEAVLFAAGANRNDVLICNVYLKKMDDFGEFNKVYADFFGDHRPARVTIEVSRLPKDALVEISAIAEI